jgi:hypothetical protein
VTPVEALRSRSIVRAAAQGVQQAHDFNETMASIPDPVFSSNVMYVSPKAGTQSYNLAQLRNG